jgi:hypothetical protein
MCANGPLEGHVNRLKLLKRSMYGRANFDLLKLRVLYHRTKRQQTNQEESRTTGGSSQEAKPGGK